jgi:hypothetical protein
MSPTHEEHGPPATPAAPPPRAFTQGVGTVYQFAGGALFMVMMFICCISGLFDRDWAIRPERAQVGWHLPWDERGEPTFSATMSITAWVFGGILFGLAIAGLGLGMQAEHLRAAYASGAVSGVAFVFYAVQTVFAATALQSIVLTLLGLLLVVMTGALMALGIAAAREMHHNPPPPRHDVLPADYKVPYSHMHQDPPEVRLERELAQRRERLAVQQKELEILEERLKRKLEDDSKRE